MPGFHETINWLQQNSIEIIAVLSGLLYVIFTIKENILLWLFGIISSALYVYIFLKSGIYAYSMLYIYYVLIGFYGWYAWGRKDEENYSLRIRKTPVMQLALYVISTFILALPVYFLLKRFTGSDMALTDAALTSGGMIATWMLTRKLLEQWIFWIVIDLVSFGVMIYKGLYPSALLFLIYTVLAIKGYFEWRKNLVVT